MLVFGGVASAAELSVSQDLRDETSVRLEVSGFYGELEWHDGDTDLEGINIGIKARTESPFYGIAQLNFWEGGSFEHVEVGGGAEFQTLWNVSTGAEVTVTNPRIADLGSFEPNLTIFASVDFCLFPSPQAGTCGVEASSSESYQDEDCWPCGHDEYEDN